MDKTLRFGDTVSISDVSNSFFCAAEGLLDTELVLSSYKDDPDRRVFGLFTLGKTLAINSAVVGEKLQSPEKEGEKDAIGFGVEVLFRHVHSGRYLSIDPYSDSGSTVKLLPLREQSRIRLQPAPDSMENADGQVTDNDSLQLSFSFQKIRCYMSKSTEGVTVSFQAYVWKLNLVFSTVEYPDISPYSFVHVKHANLALFLRGEKERVVVSYSSEEIATYWQLEPVHSDSEKCRLRNVYTQDYLRLTTNDTMDTDQFAVTTSMSEIGVFRYEANVVLTYSGKAVNLPEAKINELCTARLVSPATKLPDLEAKMNLEKTWFQFIATDRERGQMLNCVCQMRRKLEENIEKYKGELVVLALKCSEAIVWAESRISRLGSTLLESGLLMVLIRSMVFILHQDRSTYMPQPVTNMLSKASSLIFKAVCMSESCVSLLDPDLPKLLWLRHAMVQTSINPQDIDSIFKVMFTSDRSIARHPAPQTGLEVKEDSSDPVAMWINEIQFVQEASLAYQALVLRVLNHVCIAQGKFRAKNALEIGEKIDWVRLPTFKMETDGPYIYFPCASQEDFKTRHPKLEGLLKVYKTEENAPRMAVKLLSISQKEESYWVYIEQSLRLQGYLIGVQKNEAHRLQIETVLCFLRTTESVHLGLMRSSLRVLNVLLFRRWENVPLSEVISTEKLLSSIESSINYSLPNTKSVIQLQQFLMYLIDSETFAGEVSNDRTAVLFFLNTIVESFQKMLQHYFIDASFLQVATRLSCLLLQGFGLYTVSASNWIAQKIGESAGANFTGKRTTALQRLFRNTSILVKKLLHGKEIVVLWRALKARCEKEEPEFLIENAIEDMFKIPDTAGQTSIIGKESPLLPTSQLTISPYESRPNRTLLHLFQELIFTQLPLTQEDKEQMLSTGQKLRMASETLRQVCNDISKAKIFDLREVMNFLLTDAENIDPELRRGKSEPVAYETVAGYLEHMTDLLLSSKIKRILRYAMKLTRVRKRIQAIHDLLPSFSLEQQTQLRYYEAVFYSQFIANNTISRHLCENLTSLSDVHMSPTCSLIFRVRDFSKTNVEDRRLCVNWVFQQSELRAFHFLQKIVGIDRDQVENALLVSDRLLEEVRRVLNLPEPTESNKAELAVYFHLLSTCCNNSKIIVGEVIKVLSPERLQKVLQCPLVLGGYFELLLTVIQKMDSPVVKDYIALAVSQIVGVINELVAEGAQSLLHIVAQYDHSNLTTDPLIKRKQKNDFSHLEESSLELRRWKMVLSSDKLISKGVVSNICDGLSKFGEKKGLWRTLGGVKQPLSELYRCVNSLQKTEETLTFDRLRTHLKQVNRLFEDKKTTSMWLAITKKSKPELVEKSQRSIDLFEFESSDSNADLTYAEKYVSCVYSFMHGSHYDEMYVKSLATILKKLAPDIDMDKFFLFLLKAGVLTDLCGFVQSDRYYLWDESIAIIGTLLRQVTVATRNEFKNSLVAGNLHRSLLSKHCQLLISVSTSAAYYGDKWKISLDANHEPDSLLVSRKFLVRMRIANQFVGVIQTCCDLCNTEFQTFLSQWPYTEAESLVWVFARTLSELRKCCGLFLKLKPALHMKDMDEGYTLNTETDIGTFGYQLSDGVISLINSLLSALQEFVTGPCSYNQILLAKNSHLLLTLNRLLSVTFDTNEDLYARTIELLLGLVEGNSDETVIEQVLEVLNLQICLSHIQKQYTKFQQSKELPQSAIKLFIFLMQLKQRRPTHHLLSLMTVSPSYPFFMSKVGYIEIMKTPTTIEGIYFPVPACMQYMTLRSRFDLIWEVDRSTQMNQINGFIKMVKVWDFEMKHQEAIGRNRVFKFFAAHWEEAGSLSFLLVVGINILLIWTAESQEDLLDGSVCQWAILLYILGFAQTLLRLIQYVFYFVQCYPNLIYEEHLGGAEESVLESLIVEQPLKLEDQQSVQNSEHELSTKEKLIALFYRFEMLKYAGFLYCSLCAFYQPFFYAILLLDIGKNNSELHTVLKSITMNKGRLLMTFCLGLLVVYIFSIFGFIFFLDDLTEKGDINCADLLHCFSSIFAMGLKTTGVMMDPPNPNANPRYWFRTLFDMGYFILVIVIIMNITFGIILDSFSELRDQRNEKLRDIRTQCYICGHSRSEINLRGRGWKYHLEGEHSPYAYLAFFIYLNEKKIDACTGLEKYVKDMFMKEDYTFMPTTSKTLLEEGSNKV